MSISRPGSPAGASNAPLGARGCWSHSWLHREARLGLGRAWLACASRGVPWRARVQGRGFGEITYKRSPAGRRSCSCCWCVTTKDSAPAEAAAAQQAAGRAPTLPKLTGAAAPSAGRARYSWQKSAATARMSRQARPPATAAPATSSMPTAPPTAANTSCRVGGPAAGAGGGGAGGQLGWCTSTVLRDWRRGQ